MWDRDIFVKNIQLIAKRCGSQKKFNDRIGIRDAITRWKNSGFKPSINSLLKISEEFDCSIDWLLTGKEVQTTKTPPQFPAQSTEYKELYEKYSSKLIESSDLKTEIIDLLKKVDKLEKELIKFKKTSPADIKGDEDTTKREPSS